ncbi:MAG: hypothetical protein IH608_06730 [Proteobacteria bacterium]|nr:hypothetical protein [Pseudomonadota bacterium]
MSDKNRGPRIEPGEIASRHPFPSASPCSNSLADEEVSFFDLLAVVKRRWRLVALITALGTAAAVAYGQLATPIYRAQAVIAPPEQKKASAASAALAAFGGLGAELAGSLGVSVGGADANRLDSLLKSHRLVKRTVNKYDLLPILFPEEWNPERQTWKAKAAGKPPNVWDADSQLKRIFTVRNDVKTGVLTLTMDWRDARTATAMLEHFLDELALMIQEDELKKIQTNRRFVEEQLGRASDPMVVAKLQALLSEQVEKGMMARNVEQFAFELIDPPAASDERVKPKRVAVAALGGISSLLLGTFCSFAAEAARSASNRA